MHLDADIRGKNWINKRVESFKHVLDEMKFTMNEGLSLNKTENLIVFGDLNFRLRNDKDELDELLKPREVFESFIEKKPDDTTYPVIYVKGEAPGRDPQKASNTDRVLVKENSKLEITDTKILKDVTGSDHLSVVCTIEMSPKSA